MLSHCYAGRPRKIENKPGFPGKNCKQRLYKEVKETTTDFRPGMLSPAYMDENQSYFWIHALSPSILSGNSTSALLEVFKFAL